MTRAWMLVLFAPDGTSMYAARYSEVARRLFTPDIADAHVYVTPQLAALALVTDYSDYTIPGRFAIVRVARGVSAPTWTKVTTPHLFRRSAGGEGYYVHFAEGELEFSSDVPSSEWKEVADD